MMIAREDIASCRKLLRGGSRTFFAASLVLPRRVSDPAIALYAFCRLADDAVDLGSDSHAAVDLLMQRLDRAYRGTPTSNPADRAFADVVQRYAIPRAIPEALIEGFAWDAVGQRYETLEDLYSYAARVAGTVGAMMCLVMGERASDIVARACDLGIAMQLTNIARDVGEDARAGRLYLPMAWLREAGIDPDAWLLNPVFCDEIARIVQRLLDAADMHYDRATWGIQNLPRSCRPGIYAARALYAEIGRELERRHLDSVSQRAVVSSSRKLALLGGMLTRFDSEWKPAGKPMRCTVQSAETRFLVDAVMSVPFGDAGQQRRQKKVRSVEDRVVWVIDLFERLERRDQLQRTRL